MNCNEARDLLSAKLDGELSPEELANLEAHMASCEECAMIYQAYCDMDAQLGQLAEPPAALHESVMETIRREKVVTFPKKRWMFGSGTAVAAVAALLVLAIGGYFPELPIGSMSSSTTAADTATVTTTTTTTTATSAGAMMREAMPETAIEETVAESMDTTMAITEPMESSAIQESLIEVEVPMLTLDVSASQVPELADFTVEQDANGTCFCYVPGDVVEAICNNQDYGLEMPIGYLDPEALYRIECVEP